MSIFDRFGLKRVIGSQNGKPEMIPSPEAKTHLIVVGGGTWVWPNDEEKKLGFYGKYKVTRGTVEILELVRIEEFSIGPVSIPRRKHVGTQKESVLTVFDYYVNDNGEVVLKITRQHMYPGPDSIGLLPGDIISTSSELVGQNAQVRVSPHEHPDNETVLLFTTCKPYKDSNTRADTQNYYLWESRSIYLLGGYTKLLEGSFAFKTVPRWTRDGS